MLAALRITPRYYSLGPSNCGYRPFVLRLRRRRAPFQPQRSRRPFSIHDAISSLPGPLIPPTVFVGLAITLWAYKCAMMVVFQNKIIYMPSMPPFSRSESIADYAPECKPVAWEERRITAEDGTALAMAVGSIPPELDSGRRKKVIVLYFQGNGGSTPLRLPMLSAVLRGLDSSSSTTTECVVAALSYRGYWTSRGRPSEGGLRRDARAALEWASTTYPDASSSIVLWGQSLGAGVATDLLRNTTTSADKTAGKRIAGLLLETPFLSIQTMLLALYPQRWLPYRYLSPFLRNHWDSQRALLTFSSSAPAHKSLPILILSAANDELVPQSHAPDLEGTCRAAGLSHVRRKDVAGALHNDVTIRKEGRDAVVEFLRDVGEKHPQKGQMTEQS